MLMPSCPRGIAFQSGRSFFPSRGMEHPLPRVTFYMRGHGLHCILSLGLKILPFLITPCLVNLLSFLSKALPGYHFSSTCRGRAQPLVSFLRWYPTCVLKHGLSVGQGACWWHHHWSVLLSLRPQHQFARACFSGGKVLERKPSYCTASI